MTCHYCQDEVCVNDRCPMLGDFCPVPDVPEVCKHDSRNVECNFFDKVEIYSNCTVEVLTNSVTGAVSIGWRQNGKRSN